MLIRTGRDGFQHAIASEITPPAVYEDRRRLLKWMATGAAGAALATWAQREALAQQVQRPGKPAPLAAGRSTAAGAVTMEKVTEYKDATTYNNYYEFGTDKADPAQNAHTLKTRPWTVAFEGEIKKPQVIDVDKLLHMFRLEERVYRLRCVEAWSMVIPWVGFPLGWILSQLEP